MNLKKLLIFNPRKEGDPPITVGSDNNIVEFPYERACEISEGCRLAHATPREVLPQKRPNADQPTLVLCHATLALFVVESEKTVYGRLRLTLAPLHPDNLLTRGCEILQSGCSAEDFWWQARRCEVRLAHETVEDFMGTTMDVMNRTTTAYVDSRDFERGKINLDARQGPLLAVLQRKKK